MIGLPTETDEDLVAIRDLTIEIRERMMEHARARGAIGRIVASVNPLVPKPGTTYQWMPMTPAREIDDKVERLRGLVAGHRQRLLQHQVGTSFLLPGPALARRPPRRRRDRARRAQRRQLARRRRRRRVSTPTPTCIATASADAFLPWQIIDGGMKTSFFRQRIGEERARGVDPAESRGRGAAHRRFRQS